MKNISDNYHYSNNTENHNSTIVNSLRYQSPVSKQEYKIDHENNLHICEKSILKDRRDIVPLDLMKPQPIIKKHLDKNLMILALMSAVVSGFFFVSAIYLGHLWTVGFAIVFWLFSIGSIVAAHKNRTKTYQYQFINSNSPIFILREPFNNKTQVRRFVSALNKRITAVNIKPKNSEIVQLVDDKLFSTLGSNKERGMSVEGKFSQYIKHLDFLFNHGVVDEVLYKKLQEKINNKITDSENRFLTEERNGTDIRSYGNNIINFPICQ